MDKTGFSQADFAISFAIFLVYLMFIFVYLKPVSLPSVSSDVLLSMHRCTLFISAFNADFLPCLKIIIQLLQSIAMLVLAQVPYQKTSFA